MSPVPRVRLCIYAVIFIGCAIWMLAIFGAPSLFETPLIPLWLLLAIILVVLVLIIRKPPAKPSPALKGRPIALVSAVLLALEFLISMLVDMNGELPYLGPYGSILVIASVFGGYIGTAILLLRRDKRWWPYVTVGLALTLLLGPVVYAFEEILLQAFRP